MNIKAEKEEIGWISAEIDKLFDNFRRALSRIVKATAKISD